MPGDARTIGQLSRALRLGETTARAEIDASLQRIAARNPDINAFIAVFEDEARAQAEAADREMKAGRDRGPLHGVPVSVKDLFDIRGAATTAASRVRQRHVAQRDASAIVRLREAGAIIVGKTNLHEFALGTTNEDSAFGPARHPLDSTRSPGGSSGGSAASVADGMCFASLGTDTGGSIRIPAAACGLVGLKPSLGELATDGVVPLSRTMDHIGPICRSVADAETIYDALRGGMADPPAAPAYLGRVTLGIPREYFLTRLDAEVGLAFEHACQRLREAGVTFEEVRIPHAEDVAPIYVHIVLSEAAALHARTLDGQPDDYTPNVRLRLESGRYVMAEDYVRALRGREVLTREVDTLFDGLDGLFLPALAIPAPRIGAVTALAGGVEEPVRNLMLRCTQVFNVTGHPAIALPCGRTTEGMPVGVQVVGRRDGTRALLRIARAIEPFLG